MKTSKTDKGDNATRKLLEGTRVIDFSHWHAAPFASLILQDFGAEVIHIEELKSGDGFRGLTFQQGKSLVLPNGRNYSVDEVNRGKKSMAIDLKKPQSRDIMNRLVKNSDAFVTNFRKDVRVKLGMDYESLSKLNPKLIYASASLFGDKGPEANNPGYDLIGLARSGIMMESGLEDQRPIYLPVGISDRLTAWFLAFGIVAALLAKEKFGLGQQVHASQLGSLMSIEAWTMLPVMFLGEKFESHKRKKPGNPLYNFYRCKDDIWIALGMPQYERHWPTFCKALGISDLELDARFVNIEKTRENSEELVSILDKIFLTKNFDEWVTTFKKYDLNYTRVSSMMDLLSDPQVIANGYILPWDYDGMQNARIVGHGVELSRTPMNPNIKGVAPEHGQHTEEVLLQVCNCSWDEISNLRDNGVI